MLLEVNSEASRLAGISVNPMLLKIMAISGVCAAIAGIITASRLGVGSPVTGYMKELDAITAVILGGTAMTGGGWYHSRYIYWCFSSNNSNQWFDNYRCFFLLATDFTRFCINWSFSIKEISEIVFNLSAVQKYGKVIYLFL